MSKSAAAGEAGRLYKRLAVGLVLALLAGSFLIQPVLTGPQDAPVYLGFMKTFLDVGWRAPLDHEPLFPLFLGLFARAGLAIETWLPFVQNALFLGSLFVLVRTMTVTAKPRAGGSAHAWLIAALVTAVPTFWLTMNGAVYTESLSADLVCLYLAAVIHLRGAAEQRRWPGGVASGVAAVVCSVALALNKGTFIYVQAVFPLLLLLVLGASLWRTPRQTAWPAFWVLTGVLAVSGVAGREAASAWLASREGSFVKAGAFGRGGVVLFGRAAYAERFDFVSDTAPFLLNALSESACRRVIGNRCEDYTSNVEYTLGAATMNRQGLSSDQAFALGKRLALASPVRQLAFFPFEWSRFILHHTTSGFARLEVPGLGPLSRSTAFLVLLTLFNLALYFYAPCALFLFLGKGRAHRAQRVRLLSSRWSELPFETRTGILACLLYGAAYLLVYGMATTVVRMCYPIAPLLVLLNWQGFVFLRSKS